MEFIAAALSIITMATGSQTLMQATSITPSGNVTVSQVAKTKHNLKTPPKTNNYLPAWRCKAPNRYVRVCTTKVKTPKYTAHLRFRYNTKGSKRVVTTITYKVM